MDQINKKSLKFTDINRSLMVNLMADTGLMGLDTVGIKFNDTEEQVVKVFVYEPKPTLSPEILLGTSKEAEKLRLLHQKYLLEGRFRKFAN